jgi:RNA-directed DNA polymerase
MSFSLSEHIIKAEDEHRSIEFIDAITAYGIKLKKKGLPVIFSTLHFALLVGYAPERIWELIKGRESFYKTYKLRKKTGGYRWIMSPDEELKYVQGWIKTCILEKAFISDYATGFIKGRSIKQNADIHLNKEVILNIDLYRFFDSISERRVYGLFKSLGYHPNLAVDLAKLLCISPPKKYWKEVKKENRSNKKFVRRRPPILPQGSPASPLISNLIAYGLDKRLAGLCSKFNLSYSRYADDITISGAEADMVSLNTIKKIIRQEGLTINHKKIRRLRKNQQQAVTGIVTNDKIAVPKEFKKNVLTHLYYCNKRGPTAHQDYLEKVKGKPKKKAYKDWLLGKISFIYGIEPEAGKKMYAMFNQINWEI